MDQKSRCRKITSITAVGSIETCITSTECSSYVPHFLFDPLSQPYDTNPLQANHTFQAAEARTDPPRRPFVLTRAFYAGSQRFGAMWTGDNLGTWEHMAVGIKMVLANGVGGMPFAGCKSSLLSSPSHSLLIIRLLTADVGGFFGNPEPEMLVRWYVVGAFSPFFRAHAHIDTKRREPYLLEEPYKSLVRDILRLRYSMLPVWYTAFRETSENGVPILRCVFLPPLGYMVNICVNAQTSIYDVPQGRSWVWDR